MNVKEIIIEKLKELGADGLCYENCGCSIDYLCPCESDCLECIPAKKEKCEHCDYQKFVPLEDDKGGQLPTIKNKIPLPEEFKTNEGKKMKYRKKPVIVEAMQFVPQDCCELADMVEFITPVSSMEIISEDGVLMKFVVISINTISGKMKASYGDWIIKGGDGKGGLQCWPVTYEYFAQNYEEVKND